MYSVLVVDDDSSIRDLLKGAITQFLSYEVDTAENGFEAIKMVLAGNYDMILMDIKMPKLNGIDAIVAIRTIKKDIPIMIITGYASEAEKEEGLKAGANELMTKPLSITDVISKVKYYCENFKTESFEEKSEDFDTEIPEKVVVIGSSVNGPKKLVELFNFIETTDFPPLIIIQHMPSGFMAPVVEGIKEQTEHEVLEAKEGLKLENGKIYFAPSPNHILSIDGTIYEGIATQDQPFEPSIAKTAEHFSDNYKHNCLFVLFKGVSTFIDSQPVLFKIKSNGTPIYALNDNSNYSKKLMKDKNIDGLKSIEEIANLISKF